MAKLALLVGLTVLAAFAAIAESYKLRTCGLKLIKRLRNICTPEGYSEPCVHAPEDYAPVNKRSLPYNYRFKRSAPTNGRYEEYDPEDAMSFGQAVFSIRKRSEGKEFTRCCDQGCDDDYIRLFCCNEKELERFKSDVPPK